MYAYNKGSGWCSDDKLFWWSRSLNDLYAWSEDEVVAAVCSDNGSLMVTGHFEVATPKKWEGFELLLQNVTETNLIAQAGHSTLVVAAVSSKLYFRIFGPDGKKVLDIDEDKLPNRRPDKLKELKNELARKGTLDPGPRQTEISKLRFVPLAARGRREFKK